MAQRSHILLIGGMLVLAACAKLPSAEEADHALLTIREYESWAWAAGIVLIWIDVALPIPQTSVIAALGIIYGPLLGGVLGSIAMITGGMIGYALMLTSARRLVNRVGGRSLRRMDDAFARRGAWAIVLTRSLPYSIPEAVTFLAGLARMPPGRFVMALAIGSVPAAFVFAAIGAGWADRPALALLISYVIPILLLPAVLHIMRRAGRRATSGRRDVSLRATGDPSAPAADPSGHSHRPVWRRSRRHRGG